MMTFLINVVFDQIVVRADNLSDLDRKLAMAGISGYDYQIEAVFDDEI